MGNKTSVNKNKQGRKTQQAQQTPENVSIMYQELISRDFDDKISMIAAKKYPKNFEKAVDFILNQIDKNDDISFCNGDDILKCSSLFRLRETLIFCNKYSQNTQKIESYFNQNKNLIINNYHHLLNFHLNEDNLSNDKSNQQFSQIYDLLRDHDLKCDISKCIMYKRNNRQRDIRNGNIINVEIDILDSIHCYFLHSIDDGIRFLNDDDDDYDNEYFDFEIDKLQNKLFQRINIINQLRGMDRIKKSKYVTCTQNVDNYKKGMYTYINS